MPYQHSIDSGQGAQQPDNEAYTLFGVVEEQTRAQPMIVTVQLNSCPFSMEVDTGASLSLASETKCKVMSSQ